MSLPRLLVPGMTVLVTRRTLRRTHLLRPDPDLTALYTYCLAVLAKRHRIAVHAVVLMSTHEHLVLTDPECRLPLFLRELHRLVALGVKALRGWEGAVWDHERPSVVHLRTPEAVIEKLAYVIANPVAAGLVTSAHQWPGLTTLPHQLGCAELHAPRPRVYFDEHSPQWPECASLTLTLPALPELSTTQLCEAVGREVEALEQHAHAQLRAKGHRVMGTQGIRRASPYDRAKSFEPLRGRNPTFAVGRGQHEAFEAAVAALRAFRDAYRRALQRWRDGLRDVLFPHGTWLMRWVHGALVADPA